MPPRKRSTWVISLVSFQGHGLKIIAVNVFKVCLLTLNQVSNYAQAFISHGIHSIPYVI